MNSSARNRWWVLVAFLSLAGCVDGRALKLQYNAVPESLGDDWAIATPESQNVAPTAIENAYGRFFSDDEFRNGISLLVVRNGNLIAEGYARRTSDRTEYEAVQSVTKSVTSILTGVALDEGKIVSLDQTLYQIFPEKFQSESEKRAITLKHLLTMSSGINIDNEHFVVEMVREDPADPIQYILNKGLYDLPGRRFNYRDADPHLLSFAVQTLAGENLSHYAKSRLFTPLNITNYDWISDRNGTSYGGYGLFLTPRDLAKIGQLMLQRGKWKGQQIVSDNWISESTKKQIEKDEPDTREFEYGYYWWIIPELKAYTAWGHGGNFVVVIPDKQMVVVLTSMPYSGNAVGTHLTEFLPVLRILVGGA